MIKVISKKRYSRILSENKLLRARLYGVIGSYDDMTYAELNKIRRERIKEVKQIEQKIKELTLDLGKNTAVGGNYKRYN